MHRTTQDTVSEWSGNNGGSMWCGGFSLRLMEQFRIFVVCAGPTGAVGSAVLHTFPGILPALTSL